MSIRVKQVTVTAVLILLAGLIAWPKIAPHITSDQQTADFGPSTLRVEGVVIEPEPLDNTIYISGTIEANEAVELRSEMAGKVTGIFFEEGSRITAGELLLKINDSELQAERRRTEFQLNLAEQREARQSRLLERGGISRQEYDVTANEVNTLRASLDLIDARIEKSEIRAPFDGRIGLKFISKGSFISSDTRIATLNDIDRIKINFSVPERYSTQVQPGDQINFQVQGVDSQFTGRVYALEPRIERETRTLRMRAISDNPEHVLLPGAFANIELILESTEDALMIPTISVIPGFEGQTVFIYRDGQVDEVEVELGVRTDEAVQIIRGVAPGDTVLTTGLLQVRPGMSVDLTSVTRFTDR
ncbi:MAG: efflux RND transporter periplasmic adaptor subunit [Balneolaceae bacterium]